MRSGAVLDAEVFGDANHELLVVGSAEEGFRLWCRRCDRLGDCTYGDFAGAAHCAAAVRKDIAPACRPRRSAA